MEEEKPKGNIGENIKTIHTYSSDMADAVRQNEVSVIKIALAEQKKHEQEALYKKSEGTSVSKTILFLGGLIIIAVAVGGIYYLVQKKKADSVVTEVATNIDTLISYDSQTFIDMTNTVSVTDVAGILQTEVAKGGTAGSIKSLFLTHATTSKQEFLPLEDFLNIIKTTAPSSLTRSLDDSYMVGTYQSKDDEATPHLFFLLKTTDYNQSYAGMLAWEKTLLDDFFVIFHIDVSGDRSTLFEKSWKDIIIENKDARILYDTQGNPVLYYLFIDKNTFIITDSQDTIKEVSSRLLAKKIKPL